MTTALPLGKNRDFTRLWGSLAFLDVGSNLTFIALPLLTLDLFGASAVGLVAAVGSIGSLAILPVAGVTVDRTSRRAVMQWCLAVRISTLFVGIALYLIGWLTLPALTLIAFVLGAASSSFRPSETSAIRRIVLRSQWPQAFSRNQVRSAFADIIGTAVAGFAYAIGRLVPWIGDAVCTSLALLGVSGIRKDLGKGDSTQSPLADIRDGARFVFHSPVLRILITVTLVANFASYWPAFVVLMKGRGVASGEIGLLGTGIGIAGILGAVSSEFLLTRLPRRAILPGSLIGVSACLFAMAFSQSPIVGAVALFIGTALTVPSGVASAVTEADATPDHLIGRTNAIYRFFAMSAIPFGQYFGTLSLTTGGPELTFTVFATPLLASGLFLLIYRPFWRVLRAQPRRDP